MIGSEFLFVKVSRKQKRKIKRIAKEQKRNVSFMVREWIDKMGKESK